MDTALFDRSIAELNEKSSRWSTLPVEKKIDLLKQVLHNLGDRCEEWVATALNYKGIAPDSPWCGEEWIAGIWASAAIIQAYISTLTALSAGAVPSLRRVRLGINGQIKVQAFPVSLADALLLNGVRAEIWMKRGVTRENLNEQIAPFYQKRKRPGKVTLVLGAGNSNAIPLCDTLYKLIAEGSTVLLKLNPVNDYLFSIFNKILAPFIKEGYLRIVTGGKDEGEYLVNHPGVAEIHMTGSAQTHDAILFGSGDKGVRNRSSNTPRIDKPITSELGGVEPLIIIPGKWSDADIRYQAEHLVTTKMHNSGFNCVASQVLVLPEKWDQKEKFLEAVRAVLKNLPPRSLWYPGVQDRLEKARHIYPKAELFGESSPLLIANISPQSADEPCFREELFGPVLAQTALPGDSPEQFFRNGVKFCNEKLYGSLGATILVHPKTQRAMGDSFEKSLAQLRYGSIGINIWNAGAFLFPYCTWGAFPGHVQNDIQSGTGVVHNGYLLQNTERTVVYGPFYPFPRSFLHGSFTILPKPPWFVTNRTAHLTGKAIAWYMIDKKILRIPAIFAAALRG